MDIFLSIGKAALVFLLSAILLLFTMDFGKVFLAQSQNSYAARNASSFVSEFSIDVQELIDADYGEEYVDLDDVKDNLAYYLKKHYENTGYVTSLDHGGASLPTDQFKMVFVPEHRSSDYSTIWGDAVFVRAKFYGFDGTPPIPGGSTKSGLIRINIEEKIPAGIRNFMIQNGLPFRTVENPTDGRDFEGYLGYYSIESEHAFTINIVK